MGKLTNRIHILRDATDEELLYAINAADVTLDSLYTGGAVSPLHVRSMNSAFLLLNSHNNIIVMQSLAMGVPMITLPGIYWRSRITYGFYQQLGVMDCVATSLAEFAHLAMRVVLDDSFRADVSARLLANQHRLFNDKAAIQQWEDFFSESYQKTLNTHQVAPGDPILAHPQSGIDSNSG